jgi:hypothetical protein
MNNMAFTQTIGKSSIYIGNTANRGTAARGGWMGRGEVIGSYEGSIPKQVARSLVDWEPLEVPSANLIPVEDFDLADTVLPDGRPAKTMIVEGVKSIVRSDTFANLGRFKEDYNGNGYGYYMDATEAAVGDLPYLSIGELHGGRQFFFQVGMNESQHDGTSGLEFMPYLMFQSSLDGSLANTWSRGSIICKCDNMFPAIRAQARGNGQVKFKRSRLSNERLENLPALLGVQAQNTRDFAAGMVSVPVLRSQFVKVLDREIPLPDRDKASKAAYTRAENARDAVEALYTSSPMVADWNGTAFGVFQAFNTYNNREKQVRGANRIDRVFDHVLRGVTAENDMRVIDSMQRVLGRELLAV